MNVKVEYFLTNGVILQSNFNGLQGKEDVEKQCFPDYKKNTPMKIMNKEGAYFSVNVQHIMFTKVTVVDE